MPAQAHINIFILSFVANFGVVVMALVYRSNAHRHIVRISLLIYDNLRLSTHRP